jgi:hypothetical protein
MFALRAQDFSSFAVVVTTIIESGSQFERSEAQITGTHHRYPLPFFAYQKFHSPERGAGHIIMRRLSRTFAAS